MQRARRKEMVELTTTEQRALSRAEAALMSLMERMEQSGMDRVEFEGHSFSLQMIQNIAVALYEIRNSEVRS